MSLIKKLSPALTTILTVAATFMIVLAMLAATTTPERYDIRVGEVSPIRITATKDVEDKLATDRLIEAAARAVPPSYVSDNAVQPSVLSALHQDFNALLVFRSNTPPVYGDETVGEGVLNIAREALPMDVEEEVLDALARINADTLSSLYEHTYAYVRETLSAKLPEGQEEEAIQKILRDLSAGGFSDGAVVIAEALVRHTLRPNMLLDEETTEQNRQREREKVERVIYKKGQNIVQAGEVVTANQIAMLTELGLIVDDHVDVMPFLGLGALLMLLLGVLIAYMYVFRPPSERDARTVMILSLIIVITAALCTVCMLVRPPLPYAMPVALGAMLTATLISPQLALMVNVILSVIAGLLASLNTGSLVSDMYGVMLISILSGSLCVSFIRKRPHFRTLLLAGVVVSVVNTVAVLAVGLIHSASLGDVLPSAWHAGLAGVISTLFCVVLELAFEWMFNLVTSNKLLELTNPNHPLLRRLLLEAPGTYHHSILVANLSEAAANAVGADGLLARVGAYYHDIGKLKRPLYFKENQLGDNPHDRADPRVSTAILTAHPRDGVEMGQKARLPQAVLNIIAEHHGDTPVLFFYDKAVKQGDDVDLNGFRYDYERPRSREAAIVMLADTVEAAARAIPDPTQEKLNQLIRRLVRSKMEDGQLDESPLTFSDLNLITETFEKVLSGVYHERVEYPDIAPPERRPVQAPEPESLPEVEDADADRTDD